MSNPAEGYEGYMVPTLFGPWASHLVQAANPQLGDRILDVGCGTGVIARRVAPLVGARGKVAGLDISPDMLTVARVAAEREGLTISWYKGRAEDLPFPDGTWDRVLCQFALMFFNDRQTALTEMRRVLTRGGCVSLSVWQSLNCHPFYQTLHNVLQSHLGMSGVQDIFALGDAEELSSLLTDAGFEELEIRPVSMTARFPNPEAFLAGEIDVDTAAIRSMQLLDVQERQAIVSAISNDMEAPLHEVTHDNHVVLPFHAYVVQAKRLSK